MPKKQKKEIVSTSEDMIENPNTELVRTLKLNEKLTIKRIQELRKKCIRENLLNIFIRMGDFEGIRVLIENANVDANTSTLSNTPLMAAAQFGQLDIFKYLLTRGANLNLVNNKGLTAFCFAVWNNQFPIVKLLVDGLKGGSLNFDVNVSFTNGVTALMYATKDGSQVAHMLLELEQVKVDQLDHQKGSAILHAANSENITPEMLKVTEALIKRKANIYLANSDGVSPLMSFAARRSIAGLWQLISCHKKNMKEGENPTVAMAQFVNQKDSFGRTALHFAAFGGNLECIKILISMGSEIHDVTHLGNTVAMAAVDQERYPLVEALVKGFEVKQAFTAEKLKICIKINVANNRGETLLIHLLSKAIKHKDKGEFKKLHDLIKLLKLVIELTNELNSPIIRTKFGGHNYTLTVLALAVQLGNTGIISLILKGGGSIHTSVRQDTSVLRFASLYANSEAVFPLLLEHRFRLLCDMASVQNDKETMLALPADEAVQPLTVHMAKAIKILVEYLCGDSEFLSLRVDSKDNLILNFGPKTTLILTDQDIYVVIQQIIKSIMNGELVSPLEITQILKSSVKSFKEREQQKILSEKSEQFTSLLLKFYRNLCDKNIWDDLKSMLDESYEDNPRVDVKALDIYLSEAFVEIDKLKKLKEDFLSKATDLKLKFKKLSEDGNIAELDKIIIELASDWPAVEKTMGALSELTLEIKKILNDVDVGKMRLSKKKTKGLSVEEMIQRKISEFSRRRALDPEIDKASSVIAGPEKKPIVIDLLEKIQAFEAADLKSDNELRELETEKQRLKKVKVQDNNKEIPAKEGNEHEEEIPNFTVDLSLFKSDNAVERKLSHEFTFEDSCAIAGTTSVLDHLQMVRALLEFEPEVSLELSQEDISFLTESALWGGFGLLMEALKKHKGADVLSPTLFRVLRNFIFHEEGELRKLGPHIELKDLFQKFLVHFKNIGNSKLARKKNKDLNSFLTEINSKMFNEIIRLSIEKAAAPKVPSLAICLVQIDQAEGELARFKRICQKYPNLLDNPNALCVVQIGLGRTVARLGSYLSEVKRNYPKDYRFLDLIRYKQFIKIGNRYRHGDEEGAQPWRSLIDNVIQELLSGYIIEILDKPSEIIGKSPSLLAGFNASMNPKAIVMDPMASVSAKTSMAPKVAVVPDTVEMAAGATSAVVAGRTVAGRTLTVNSEFEGSPLLSFDLSLIRNSSFGFGLTDEKERKSPKKSTCKVAV